MYAKESAGSKPALFFKRRFEKTSSGAYKLCPKTGEGNGYVLNTSTSAGTNNANLTQDTYILNTSYRDEWLFSKPESSEYSIFTSMKVPDQNIFHSVHRNTCNGIGLVSFDSTVGNSVEQFG